MTHRLLAHGLWAFGIAAVLIVAFAAVATLIGADPLGTTLPREGWVAALIGWGIVGGAAILAIGRAASDGWQARAPIGLVILLCAVAAGVAVEVTVMRWAAARFGVQAADPDLIGWASALSPMVVLAGQAALASAVLPGAGQTAAPGHHRGGVGRRADLRCVECAGGGERGHAARYPDGDRHGSRSARCDRGGGGAYGRQAASSGSGA